MKREKIFSTLKATRIEDQKVRFEPEDDFYESEEDSDSNCDNNPLDSEGDYLGINVYPKVLKFD